MPSVAPMVSRLRALTVLTAAPEDLAVFWASLLGCERDGLDVVPGEASPLRLTFASIDRPRAGLNQMHLHLTSSATSQEETVARVFALGGTHLDVGQLPEEDHVVLADPDGNGFVLQAGQYFRGSLRSHLNHRRGKSALEVDCLGRVEADHEPPGVRGHRRGGQLRDHDHRRERRRHRPGSRLPQQRCGPA